MLEIQDSLNGFPDGGKIDPYEGISQWPDGKS
jgi:hypothetical protein